MSETYCVAQSASALCARLADQPVFILRPPPPPSLAPPPPPSLAPPPPRDRRGGPRRRLPSSASSKWEGDVVRAARERHRASAAPRAEARHLSHELERALGADLAEAWPAGLALAVHA